MCCLLETLNSNTSHATVHMNETNHTVLQYFYFVGMRASVMYNRGQKQMLQKL